MPSAATNSGSGARGRSSSRLVSGHARLGERRAARPIRDAPARRASRDHGLTVGDGVFEAVKVVDGQPFALDPAPRAAGPLGARARAAGARRRRRTPRASRRCWTASSCRSGRLRITYTGGPAPLGSGRGDGPPTLVVVAGADGAVARRPTAVATVPWPRNERGALAGLKTTSYAENVRRPGLGPPSAAPARRSSPTSRATCARAPAPTSSTSSTASCARRPWPAAAWPASPAR